MPPLEETEQAQREHPTPLAGGRRDLEWIIKVNAEQFWLLYPQLRFFQLDRAQGHDPLYGEQPKARFVDPVKVPTYIQIHPQEKLLKRFGIESEQEAFAVWSCRILNDLGLDPVTGDRVEYYGITYEVLTTKLTDAMLNTQVPINKLATLKQIAVR